MADNKKPNEKQPGEKEPGKFHFNPGNMSGKSARLGEHLAHGPPAKSADQPPIPAVDPKVQAYRDRAREARRKAEGIDSATEQSRLNKQADDLERQAAMLEQESSTHS